MRMSEEKKVPEKKGRTTTTTQVSRNLDLVVTNYAAKHGISKHEAADRIFQILYPDGAIPDAGPPIAPSPGEGPPQEIPLVGPPEVPAGGVSGVLRQAVEDLATVRTIKELSSGLKNEAPAKRQVTDLPSWEDIWNQKKMELMFGGETNKESKQDFPAMLENQRKEITAHFEKILAEQKAAGHKEDADFYKKKLEDKEAAEARAQEMDRIVTPIQEAMAQFDLRLEALAKEMKPESKEPPTSAELEAIRTLGSNIKEALIDLKSKSGAGTKTDELGTYLDSLGVVIDKITEIGKKGVTTPTGEIDWKTAAISTFGEVTTEAIKAYREGEAKSPGEKTEAPSEPISNQIIERRVYNYALKKIAAGDLSLDPYKTGEELGLTPTQVWQAILSLQKRGALKTPQVIQTEQSQKPQEKASGQEAEGLVEG